jgi:hypothetical protein
MYYVYALLDPRTETVFYVGTTANMPKRYRDHCTDRCSAAHLRIKEIQKAGAATEIHILHQVANLHRAIAIEYRLIAQFPALLNRKRRHHLAA